MEGEPPQKKWVTRDALVHILANAALHTDKLPGQWQQKTRYFFEDAFWPLKVRWTRTRPVSFMWRTS